MSLALEVFDPRNILLQGGGEWGNFGARDIEQGTGRGGCLTAICDSVRYVMMAGEQPLGPDTCCRGHGQSDSERERMEIVIIIY